MVSASARGPVNAAASAIHAAGCARSCRADRHCCGRRRKPRRTRSKRPFGVFRTAGQGNDQQRREPASRRAAASWRLPPPKAVPRSPTRITTDASVRRTARRVLVESPVRVDRREDPRGAARRQLRARGDSAARARAFRRHGAGFGEASRACSSISTTCNRSVPTLAARARAAADRRVRRAGAPRRGLNENYARELLELHTLGVNGGYTQQDVQELAKILTGWTVGGLARPRPQGAGAARAPATPAPPTIAMRSALRLKSRFTSPERKLCWA